MRSGDTVKPPACACPTYCTNASGAFLNKSLKETDPSDRHEPLRFPDASRPHKHTTPPRSPIRELAASPRRAGFHAVSPRTVINVPSGKRCRARFLASFTMVATVDLRFVF